MNDPAHDPVLGLIVDGPVEPLARALVRCLARRVRVASPGRWGAGPDAVLALGLSESAGAGELAGGRPIAVWCPAGGAGAPAGSLTIGPGVARGSDEGADHADPIHRGSIHVPSGARDLTGLASFSPLVRSRWRQRAGLPERWVVEAGGIDELDRATALAVAAAVVADGEHLAVALALGAPTVTDPVSAAAIGIDAEAVAAEVSAVADRHRVAAALAADDRTAARRSLAAATFARTELDLAGPAQRLVTALGLDPAASDGARARVAARLDALGTPPVTHIRTRAERAVAVLAPDPGGTAAPAPAILAPGGTS